ncbi:MAG: ThuA domain-containing protein [Thermoprotei archaeon]|nr:MAG: ThuA domain-containing protein [Thermoprotei archaeon]
MGRPKVLVLTHSAGFRHSYIPTAVEVLTKLGERTGRFEVFATDECSEVTRERLREFNCLLFMTTGELPMSEDQKLALIDFVREGGAFVGVHNATDTFYEFPEYGRMIGGYFNGHPWTQEVYVIVEDREHPSTRHLPERFRVMEEVYTFRDWSRDRTHVLISLDNSSVDLSKGTRPDHDYALAWCHSYGRGRVFYTAFGHFTALWREEWFQRHLLGGMLWAMGLEE